MRLHALDGGRSPGTGVVPWLLFAGGLVAAAMCTVAAVFPSCVMQTQTVVVQTRFTVGAQPPLLPGCAPIRLTGTQPDPLRPGRVRLGVDAESEGPFSLSVDGEAAGVVSDGDVVGVASGAHTLVVALGQCESNPLTVEVP